MSSDRQRRLARVSRLCAAGCLCLAALPFVAVPTVWLSDTLLGAVPAVAPGPLPSLPYRLAGIGASLLPACAMVWGLWRLHCFFRRLVRGEQLTVGAAHDLQAFGMALLARALLAPLAGAGASVAASWERGTGARTLAITVSDGDLGLLLVAGLVTVSAWVLAEAAEIADEHRLIV